MPKRVILEGVDEHLWQTFQALESIGRVDASDAE
jgi:hypothetical protein